MTTLTQSIRQLMYKQRRQLGYGAQKRAAYRLSQCIQASKSYQCSRNIACYSPVNGEIDLCFLIKHAWAQGKKCYLPIIEGENMRFVRYLPGMLLKKNRFGIPEPVMGNAVSLEVLDLALIPLLAFDRHNQRIGMGGGYYDRTFAENKYRRQTVMMGVAYQYQKVEKITPEPWDVPMDCVLTD
jgi:5-formyltetrahydrofolate cyclo-ligase